METSRGVQRGMRQRGMVAHKPQEAEWLPFQWSGMLQRLESATISGLFSFASPCKLKTGVKIQVDECISLYVWNKLDLVIQIMRPWGQVSLWVPVDLSLEQT